MARKPAARRRVVTWSAGAAQARFDSLAGEEPLEIRVAGQPVAVTMRTPGHDFELALGFCLTEGIVGQATDVEAIRYCAADDHGGEFNVLDLSLRAGAAPDPAGRVRRLAVSSACGLCGAAAIGEVARRVAGVGADPLRAPVDVLLGLPERLRAAQTVFDRTGGLHAAGVFSAGGDLLCAREDVGRHNAVDKVVGWAAGARRLPLTGTLLAVSGRVAFEIVQKALVAGIPAVVAVSAPTTLAVDLALEAGLTLVGFARGDRLNVYAGDERVVAGAPASRG